MEQPTRWANGLEAWALRGTGNEAGAGGVLPAANTVSLLPPSGDAAPRGVEAPAPKAAWSGALNLVEDASAALRHSEERIARLEAEAEQTREESRAELEALHAQLRLAQREIERAYGQAAAATARATAAEAWLERLGGTIVNSFGKLGGSSQRQAS
jgi:hypothetical protein